jgi:hypothetical protein
VLFADPFAMPPSGIVTVQSTAPHPADGLAWSRRKSPHVSSQSRVFRRAVSAMGAITHLNLLPFSFVFLPIRCALSGPHRFVS